MTPGKAGGLLDERLKGANKTVSRPRRLGFLLHLQGEGRDGGGVVLYDMHYHPNPSPPYPSP